MLSLDHYSCTECDDKKKPELKVADDCCAVCLEHGGASQKIMITPCFHSFHGDCILNWVEKNFSCPLCRVECQNFIPVGGQELPPKFVELWEAHFMESSNEPEEIAPKKVETLDPKKVETVVELSEIIETEEIAEVANAAVEARSVPEEPPFQAPHLLRELQPVFPTLPTVLPTMPAPFEFTNRTALLPAPALSVHSSLSSMLVIHASRALPQRVPVAARIPPAYTKKATKLAILKNARSVYSHIPNRHRPLSTLARKRAGLRPFVARSVTPVAPAARITTQAARKIVTKTHILRPAIPFEPRSMSIAQRKLRAKLTVLRHIL